MRVAERTDATLQQLAASFWSWRAGQQPRSRDDIPRLDRAEGWVPNWSLATVGGYRERLGEFDRQLRSIDVNDAPPEVQVDHALVGSALARVRWELDVVAAWRRHPGFYVDQTIGVLFDQLVVPPPFGPAGEKTSYALCRPSHTGSSKPGPTWMAILSTSSPG